MFNFFIIYILFGFSFSLFANPQKVLITGFSKFKENNFTNNSETIGKLLTTLSDKKVSYVYCETLPVSDAAIKKIEESECIKNNSDAKFILNLGEGECDIKFETIALNQCNNNCENLYISKFDNSSKQIYEEDPVQINFSYDASRMYCLSQEFNIYQENSQIPIKTTINSGISNYICSRVGFAQNHYLNKHLSNKNVESAFVHVPKNKCYGNSKFNPSHLSVDEFLKLQTQYSANILHKTISKYLNSENQETTRLSCPNNSMQFDGSQSMIDSIVNFGKEVDKFNQNHSNNLCMQDYSKNAVNNIFYQEKLNIITYLANSISEGMECIVKLFSEGFDSYSPIYYYEILVKQDIQSIQCEDDFNLSPFDIYYLFVQYLKSEILSISIDKRIVDFFKEKTTPLMDSKIIRSDEVLESEIKAIIEYSQKNPEFLKCRNLFEDKLEKTNMLIKEFCIKKTKILNLLNQKN